MAGANDPSSLIAAKLTVGWALLDKCCQELSCSAAVPLGTCACYACVISVISFVRALHILVVVYSFIRLLLCPSIYFLLLNWQTNLLIFTLAINNI